MKKYYHWLFLLTILVFTCMSISSPLLEFMPNARWIILFILVGQVFLLFKKRMSFGFFAVSGLYAIWCLLTFFWSESPQLTFMKSSASLAIIFTMSLSGYAWAMRNNEEKIFDYLLPVVVVTFFALILGLGKESSFLSHGRDFALYQGVTSNPNMLGALIGMSLPFCIWHTYKNWKRGRRKMFWIVICSGLLICLNVTLSRSAMLMAFTIVGGFLFAFRARRIVEVIYLIALLVISFYAVMPEIGAKVKTSVLYKFSREDQGVLFSRQWIWRESWEQAKLGGLIGGGYGVTIGMSEWDRINFSSASYGREKGNSQLAIIEEIGVIGVVLYSSLIILLLKYVYTAFKRTSAGSDRVALGLALGTICGMILHSIFEAWWTAPGSPESIIFWSTVGVALGLSDSVCRNRKNEMNSYLMGVKGTRGYRSFYAGRAILPGQSQISQTSKPTELL